MSKLTAAVISIFIMAGNIRAGQVTQRAQHVSGPATQQQIREAQQLANLKNILAQLQAEVARGAYVAPGVRREIPVPGLLRVQPNGRPGFNVLSGRELDYVERTHTQSTLMMQANARRAACERARYAYPYPNGRKGQYLNPGWQWGPAGIPQQIPCY